MLTSDLPFPQDGNGIPVAAATRHPIRSVPGDGRLQVTWGAGPPPRLVLAGDIDLTTHADLTAALAKVADSTGQVHIDLAGVRFCDVAGLRVILCGGDGQQPAPAQVTVHNLPPHLHKLLVLLAEDPAPDLVNDAVGQGAARTGHPDQVVWPRDDGSAQTPAGTLTKPTTSSPLAAEAGQRRFPGQQMQPLPAPAVPGSGRDARSRRRYADA
jgi:ABC-type transporter Mla MlaB component